MNISSFVKILFLLSVSLFLITSCEKKKKTVAQNIDNSAEIKRLIDKGSYYFDLFKNDSAIYCFDKSISLCKPIEKYVDHYVYALTLKANILQNNGDYYGSEEEITKTLPYLKKTSKPKFTYNVYTITAYNYSANYDYKNALLYHQKALELAKTPFKKSVIKADIAILYLNQKKYNEAIQLLETLLQKKVKHEKDTTRTINHYSLLLNNLGYCYMQTKNPKALGCLEKSLELILPFNDYFELVGTYNILADYHIRNKNYKLAKFYAEKAYYCAIKGKASSMKAYCLAILVSLNEGKASKKYSQLYINLIDSITTARKIHKNQSSNIKYNFNRDKEENLELKTQKAGDELEIQRQKNRSYISYIVISISIISLVFIYFYITTRGKKESDEEVFKNEIRISEKLKNELEKDIHETLAFAGNKNLENLENKSEFLNKLNRIYCKTRNISRENSEIVTNENFEQHLREMISGHTDQKLNIIVNGLNTFSWIKINRVKKITVSRVLQEILDQMKMLNNASLASITFKKEEKNIQITYVDNGNKINLENIILQKRLQNVENRIKTIKGTLNFDKQSESSFKINFKFPI
ncbi:hypothetical protein [Flavobacterium anhuiense]|uniref:tetratricopeptide repeat protein n=1 Tax=Flavobacterium anhuiense TaxID=459526 RepID=UPI003D96ACA2